MLASTFAGAIMAFSPLYNLSQCGSDSLVYNTNSLHDDDYSGCKEKA